MATWGTYQKHTVVVGATTAGVAADYGALGNLVTDDYILQLADSTLHTLSSNDFNSKYTVVSASTPLTGSDWS